MSAHFVVLIHSEGLTVLIGVCFVSGEISSLPSVLSFCSFFPNVDLIYLSYYFFYIFTMNAVSLISLNQ